MDSLNALKVFARAAELRSFTDAGQQLGLSSSAVGSRRRTLHHASFPFVRRSPEHRRPCRAMTFVELLATSVSFSKIRSRHLVALVDNYFSPLLDSSFIQRAPKIGRSLASCTSSFSGQLLRNR